MTAAKTRSTAPQSTPQITTAEEWAKRGVHTVTLPSGAVVKIRIPDLTLLIAGDAVPEQLRSVAFEEINKQMRLERAIARGEVPDEGDGDLSQERMAELAKLNRYLISVTLVEPELSEGELEKLELPSEDILMLSQFAGRERDTDARGVQLGVEPIDRWDLWRQAHECPEECTHCQKVLDALSSLRP